MIGHQEFRDLVAQDDDDHDAVAAHRESCDECARWMRSYEQVTRLAPLLAEHPDVDVAETVSRRISAKQTSRFATIVAAAASIVAVAAVAGVVIVQSNDSDRDVLAEIADDLGNSQPFRFVYSTTAQVDFDTPGPVQGGDDLPELVALSAGLPTCAAAETASVGDEIGPIDLAPVLDLLRSDDPCAGLALIDQTLTDQAGDAFDQLTADAERLQNEIQTAQERNDDTLLDRRSFETYVAQRDEAIASIVRTRNELETQFIELSSQLNPIAAAADLDGDVSRFAAAAGQEISALSAVIEDAQKVVVVPASQIDWEQVATGTWSTEGIDIAGSTETADSDERFDGVEQDPLGLAAVVLANPERLIEILESAPSESGSRVEWEIPFGLIDDSRTWRGDAVLDATTLVELVLTSGTTTVTFTPAR